jgi:glycosyltransferase involved in cell wall biosynthesis
MVTPRYAPAIGGVERQVEALARGLTGRGVEVEVITTDPTGQLPVTERRDGVLVRRFPTVGNDGVYVLSPSLGWWLWRNASRFAVLHGHSYHTPLALHAAQASWRTGVPLVVNPYYHGTGHSPLRRALHLPYRPFGGWMLGRARRVLCNSRAEERLVRSHFGRGLSSEVIPPGIAPRTTAPAPPLGGGTLPVHPGRTVVLAVGRLEPYKRIDRLVEALPYLPSEYQVAVVGDGPDRAAMADRARLLGVAPRLHLRGRVAQTELDAWYARADVFVSLSQQESFGLAVLEGAVAGAAVVASDIPAHREVGAYLPPGRTVFVDSDCAPLELARAVQTARAAGRVADASAWPVPTWEGYVEGTLRCYCGVVAPGAAAGRARGGPA